MQVDRPWIQRTWPVVIRLGARHGSRGGLVSRRGSVHDLCLRVSTLGGRLMKVMEDGNRAGMKGEETTSTETSELEAVPLGSQLLLTKESLVREHPALIRNVDYYALGQCLKVMGDVSVNKTSRNDRLE